MATLLGCGGKSGKPVDSPSGYDFSAGKKLFLSQRLEEISGIAFVPGTDTMLMSINDEEGRIYPINMNDPKSKLDYFKFADRGDYEDIAFFAGKWRVLESNGTIHSAILETGIISSPVKLLPKGEYEGMAADSNGLYVICKDCPESKEGLPPVYLIKNSGDSLYLDSTFQMDVREFMGKKKKNLLASALARHPFTREWYILSHLNESLLIADEHFKVKQRIQLSPSVFLQPEGIAFSSTGDLLISNEGEDAAGNIMVFSYQKPAN